MRSFFIFFLTLLFFSLQITANNEKAPCLARVYQQEMTNSANKVVDTLSPVLPQIKKGLFPQKGAPVAIGVLAKLANGKELLILGEQIGHGHRGLLNKLYTANNNTKITEVLWAGEVRLAQKGEGIVITSANEVAGLLADHAKNKLRYEIVSTNASVDNLQKYIEKHPSLADTNIKFEHYQQNPQHYDPQGKNFSDFRHHFKEKFVLMFGHAHKITNNKPLAILEKNRHLSALKGYANDIVTTLNEIFQVKPSLREQFSQKNLILLKQIARGDELSRQDYKNIVTELENFYDNFPEEFQIIP
ncbi:MAG: hypothetical protein A2504_12695 [Bdellovibrionales bacterium RIFOXYD12_FULL_39_22]|nr:MAG: hypothetical protein A2385_03780 [Bdellovibrionales bacterium RIFOXYB1_FULL_39_21]OFZ40472.1 MAG: hypothetical protein A2485_02645 [Bdellovibrionales bacterium RIFOXYC12_FULL_39_17]OFZ49955.1 MAG: hypothetical protein A2404_01980 [Bdellovibrionales bacterium RIFOXYC1_FULL_39_130]OFZ77597.1 MAG: hypothetical protein A2560_04540 [Bdellovibrionales bacterium RIFOXYD1_FULL_39_84]OFZ96051.1 MAG: hypothetical protein A2504_12695 [Bdellovibrionales bacterium RIFOXYD12_FULL_39_22]HLE10660.1 hy